MPRDLCTLAQVKEYLGETTGDYDGLIGRLISAASEEFHRRAGREFLPVGSNPQARTFDRPKADELGRVHFRVGDLAADPTSVELHDEDGNLRLALGAGDYVLLPRARKPGHPYTRIRLHRRIAVLPTDVLELTGDFGFPAVPENVRQAVIAQVMLWMARDVKNFSETFSTTEGRVVRPRELDAIVLAVADSYRNNLL